MDNQFATVEYRIGTYQGTIDVACNENDDNELVIIRAKALLERRYGSLPLGSEKFEVLSREFY